ncbi:cell division topological specificity factor MinE [Entomobacter blattae]|uniref:Cell division topological specificity factor n=1 Tax=Entomobacter blattae TaxID=2762277 RepID=A0A7H1NUX2_9PROT|nr:cell division topological specificity factor MinE [Entomobacter blattae]QNT79582.1 Cell division topological specificity factor [Entomobacter blattae]
MSFFSNFFTRNSSAPVARDRLQILLSHERSNNDLPPDLLAKLNREILEVIKKHISIDQEKVQVKLDRGPVYSTLEIDIEVPKSKELAKP